MRVERVGRADWGLSTTTLLEIPNHETEPLSCIFLGPNDQSGGCIITPVGGNNLNGNPATVGPGAPLYFPTIGTLQVTPLTSTTGSGTACQHTLDLMCYYGAPPSFVPIRPPLRQTGSFITGAGAGGAALIPTFGRKQLSVIMKVGAQAVADLTITAYVGGTTIARTLWTLNPGAASTVYVYSLDGSNQPNTPATGEQVPQLVDFLGISSGVSAGGASAVTYEVLGVD